MFYKGLNFIGFIRIMFSPVLIFTLLGGIIYYTLLHDTFAGKLTWTLLIILGFILGVLWAMKIAKRQDPQSYLSKMSSSEDIGSGIKKDAKKKSPGVAEDFNY
ncbi:MAG: hypothetical protein IPM74_05285 [Crocinitomicaceae bacterium]|nr:hypothetical protein [Crocinitomicaceae bacterium]MBK8925316.1 hypothetical protein [Crocinitomicaceae bacterium]